MSKTCIRLTAVFLVVMLSTGAWPLGVWLADLDISFVVAGRVAAVYAAVEATVWVVLTVFMLLET